MGIRDFFKKLFSRNNEKRNKRFSVKSSYFRIPQIVKVKGLKKEEKYEPTMAISPIFGRQQDGKIPKSILNRTPDVKERYDAFRDVKMISDEEKIRKYGTKYPEFHVHTNESNEKYLGKKNYYQKDSDNYRPPFDKENFSNEYIKKEPLKPITNNSQIEEEEKEPLNFSNDEDLAEIAESLKSEPLYEEEELPDYLQPEVITSQRIDTDDIEKQPIFNQNISREERLPNYSIFSQKEITLNDKPQWLLDHITAINDTLAEFGIDGSVVGSTKGPTVTRYEIGLERGINVKRISQLSDNFKMNLKVTDIRIQAPIPGRPYVGIEVPNVVPETVLFGNCIHHEDFLLDKQNPLKIVLGVDIDGKYLYGNIKTMPHCLIAGTTGSGKSVCLNTIIMSLLLRNTADELRFILIDPKMVELIAYNELPHLITPVITDPKVAAYSLSWAVNEMEKRFQIFSKNRGVKDHETYNARIEAGQIIGDKMPYIVIVIDELADLMAVASNDVETSIQRLAAKARAAGIHLIVATQRPTTNIVKGAIKANLTTRIAFRVASYIDSTTIIDESGAENLLGKGDMLYRVINEPHRIQGAYIPDNELLEAIDFFRLREKPDYIFTHDELVNLIKPPQEYTDELFEDVAIFVVNEQRASIGMLQRKFNIGFARAQRLIEMLEQSNIVAESKGNNQARNVLVSTIQLRKMLGYDEEDF